MIKKIVFLLTILYQQMTLGIVICSPSSCSPACNSSCTYYTCTQAASHTFALNQIPLTSAIDADPPDACFHSITTSNTVPFVIDGISKNSLPTAVVHSYVVCQAQTNIGGICPVSPPPPSPPSPPPPPPPCTWQYNPASCTSLQYYAGYGWCYGYCGYPFTSPNCLNNNRATYECL